MKQFILPLALILALPATAQNATPETDPPTSTMERGLRLFMDGLRDEMEPALRELEGLAQDAAPLMRRLQQDLGDVVDDLDVYEAPEILPNGDIIIRRKEPLPVDEVEPNADGSIDL